MVCQLMLTGAIALVLGFFCSYNLRGKRRAGTLLRNQKRSCLKSCGTGMCDCTKAEMGASTDIIIVGAGVVGSALAYTLGKDGRRVHVIERDLTEPDRIVGELLQPGAYLRLIELGLDDCVNEIDAQRVCGFAVYKDGKKIKVPYPLKNFHPDVIGTGFHHGRFIQRIRKKASSLPNVSLEQGTVTSLLREKGTVKGVHYKRKGSHQELTAHAALTIVCDGCYSNLRCSLCNPKIDIHSYSVGLVLEHCQLPYANHAHVILDDPSTIMFYPISSTEIRCLVDIPGRKVPYISTGEMTSYLKTRVAPQVPPELLTAFLTATDKGNIKSVPNGIMPAAPHPTPSALLMGDAVNMRHPITGNGITVALSDIVVLRDLLRTHKNLNDAPALRKCLESFYTLRKSVAFTVNTLAGALHKLLSASPDPAKQEMRQVCFDYLSLGRAFSNGPIAALCGLNLCPVNLVLHFFVVGTYAVGRLLLPFPSPRRVWLVARMISSALGIIIPIIKAEGVRPLFLPCPARLHDASQISSFEIS